MSSGRVAVILRVELAQRAGRAVARVGEEGQAGVGALVVDLLEGGARQVDLAAHLDQRRRVVGQDQRDAADGADVRR